MGVGVDERREGKRGGVVGRGKVLVRRARWGRLGQGEG